MTRKKPTTEPTDQINFRLRVKTIDRMERYNEQHKLHPSLTSIVESAVNEWLDREEPLLARPARPKSRG